MITIAVYGCMGRMGRAIASCAGASSDVRVAAAVERPGHPAVGSPYPGSGERPVTVCDDEAAAAQADVVVSFADPASSARHAEVASAAGVPIVIGTTGFSAEEKKRIEAAAAKVPIVLSPNMSVGVNVLTWLVGKAAGAFGPEYDVEIVETHHRHKADAPSGTALRLAEAVAEARGVDLAQAAVYGREGRTGERPKGQIGIHAVRLGDIAGEHRILFGAEGETFELVHRSSSRAAYASGTLDAVRFVMGNAAGLYDMFDVIGL